MGILVVSTSHQPHIKPMTLRTTRSAIDAALSQQRFYRDTFAGLDRSGVLEAALVYKETTKALGALGMSLSGALDQANIAQGIFRQYKDLGVDRLLRESMFSVGTAAEIARNASTASEALAKALETSGILKSLTGLKDTPAHVAFGYAEQLASAKESLGEKSWGLCGSSATGAQPSGSVRGTAGRHFQVFRPSDPLVAD